MKGKFIAAVTAAVLAVFATEAPAKPVTIDYTGKGCQMNTGLDPDFTYAQTFKPTFTVLKKARFVMFGLGLSDGFTKFVVRLRDSDGQLIATSHEGRLSARTGHDDATAGDSVAFIFGGLVGVTPGQSYRLQLEQVDASGEVTAYLCVLSDPLGDDDEGYADGYMIWNDNVQQGMDVEFAVTGNESPD